MLRFPGGNTEAFRLVAIAGRLPFNFDRPLNQARTAYKRFVLSDASAEPPVYAWTENVEK